ncbi:MAG TPA: hypothetical protein VF951_13295 [Streptosporangiaceae bacterium]
MPPADMQWRARKIAMQASKLADRAAPMTKSATRMARRRAGTAATWAKPHVGRARAWMAVRAARGSISMRETVGPGGSAMLAMAARKLDPPKMKSRRWPRVLAGTALLAGCAAAATAMAMRKNTRMMRSMQPSPMPSGSPSSSTTEAQSAGLNPKAEAERARREAEVNGLSRTTTR